jgi:hypothetical protein
MYSWALFCIWGYIMSLKSSCTGIQTLLKVLYTPFQLIYHFVVLNNSSVTATSLALKVTNKRDITYPLIRSGGISLNRLRRPFKRRLAIIIPLRRKSVSTKLWCDFSVGKYNSLFLTFSYPATPLTSSYLGPHTPTRCRKNRSNKDTRYMESRITGIYMLGYEAQERRVYKPYSNTLRSPLRAVSFARLPLRSPDGILPFIWTIISPQYPYLLSYRLASLVLWELRARTRRSLILCRQ